MAMIYCRECGARHSDRAKSCPKCGYVEFDASKSMAIYLVLLWFFGIFGIYKFYAGKTNQGIAMLLMTVLAFALLPIFVIALAGNEDVFVFLLMPPMMLLIGVSIWAFIDLIIALCNIKHPEKIFAANK